MRKFRIPYRSLLLSTTVLNDDLIYIKLLCEPVRKAACPEDWITQQITQYANVQTQTQSTVGTGRMPQPEIGFNRKTYLIYFYRRL